MHDEYTTQEAVWLPTSLAAKALGCHPLTLRKYASRYGVLEPETHFVRGPFATSTIRWNVPACRATLHRLGARVAQSDVPEGLKRYVAAKKAGRDQ